MISSALSFGIGWMNQEIIHTLMKMMKKSLLELMLTKGIFALRIMLFNTWKRRSWNY